ncbi:MAG: hypothetical protein WCV58_01615 [Patescibacteria group bacterium]|jgi:hypothetical protein
MKDKVLVGLEKSVERSTGRTVKYLRETPICQQRRDIEAKTGKPMRIVSSLPRILDSKTINQMVDKALRT